MNIPPSEADLLDLPTYEALLTEWNSDDDLNPPDAETAMAILDAANSDPRLIN